MLLFAQVTWEAFGAWLSIVATIAGSSYLVGKGLGALKVSVEGLLKGEAARCVEHTEQLKALKADVDRHQGWLSDHTDTLRDHENCLTRLKVVSEDG